MLLQFIGGLLDLLHDAGLKHSTVSLLDWFFESSVHKGDITKLHTEAPLSGFDANMRANL